MKVESAQAAYAAHSQPLTQTQQLETAEVTPATLEDDKLSLTNNFGGENETTDSGNSGGELPPRPPE